MILDLAHKFDKMIEPNPSYVELERPVVKKLKSPLHTSRIQKQISLYERDKSIEVGDEQQQLHRPVVRQRSHRSVDRMETSAFIRTEISLLNNNNINPSPVNASKTVLPIPSKTKSCVNLKNYSATTGTHLSLASTSNVITTPTNSTPATPTAGALIVKENFIEPPKRVTKSFHGRTDLSSKEAKSRTISVAEASAGERDRGGEGETKQGL